MTPTSDPERDAYARQVADADGAYMSAIGQAIDQLGDAFDEHDPRLRTFRASSAVAERTHAHALTAAVASLAPALAASTRDIDALAARDQADGTAFTAASIQRHEQLVATRTELMIAALRPGSYARTWHDELMASVARAARPAGPAAA